MSPHVEIIHRSQHYAVRFLRCDDRPSAVVCFEYWLPSPSLDATFSAEGFFTHRGMNAIGILAAENDWYQSEDIEAALAAIRAATSGYELIGFSASMGAYASINFADRLGLKRVIAVCPQYSIDPARAPYETRWPREAARIQASGGFQRDRIDQVEPPVEGWLIYDPTSVDSQHAAAIQARHHLLEVPVRFAGHHEMRLLQQANMFTPMLLDMIANNFDLAAFGRRLRAERRASAAFWLGLSEALLRHRWPRAALRAVAQARALPHPEPAEIDIQQAKAELAIGNHDEARRLALEWAADRAWGWAAASILENLPEPADAARSLPAETSPRWRRWLGKLRVRSL